MPAPCSLLTRSPLVQKIHNVLGTPTAELLAKFTARSAHVDLNFPHKAGSGVAKLIPHVAPECADLISRLLAYDPDSRLSARQALKHPYFKEPRCAMRVHCIAARRRADQSVPICRDWLWLCSQCCMCWLHDPAARLATCMTFEHLRCTVCMVHGGIVDHRKQ